MDGVIDDGKNLNERLKSIEDILNAVALKKSKVKGLKIDKWGWKNKLKKNYCAVQIIRSNGLVEFKMLPIEDDIVRIPKNDTFHLATVNYMLHYKKYPLLIVPEWNLIPYNPVLDYSSDDKLALACKIIITKVKQAQAGLLKKKGFDMKMILVIGGVVIAGIYLVSKFMGGGAVP